MMLALTCDRVVATDISPRALSLARANTLLNGIDNVDLRQGDFFTPVGGESFDLIVSSAPFRAPSRRSGRATRFFSGASGGTSCLCACSHGPGRTSRARRPGVADGRVAGGRRRPAARGPLRDAVGRSSDLGLLIIVTGASDIDVHCAAYGQIRHDGLEADDDRVTMLHREHFERARSVRSSVPTRSCAARPAGWSLDVDGDTRGARDAPRRERWWKRSSPLGSGDPEPPEPCRPVARRPTAS